MGEQVKAYTGITITLTTHGVRYNLFELLQAIDPNVPSTCRELNIQYDPEQAGAADALFIGDSAVSGAGNLPDPDQRCAFSCQVGGSLHYGAGACTREVYITNIWLVSESVDGMLVNVEIQN